MIHDYASGRKMQPPERMLFSGAARSRRVAAIFDSFGARKIGPARMMATAMPLAVATNARHALRRRRAASRREVGVATVGASKNVDASGKERADVGLAAGATEAGGTPKGEGAADQQSAGVGA